MVDLWYSPESTHNCLITQHTYNHPLVGFFLQMQIIHFTTWRLSTWAQVVCFVFLIQDTFFLVFRTFLWILDHILRWKQKSCTVAISKDTFICDISVLDLHQTNQSQIEKQIHLPCICRVVQSYSYMQCTKIFMMIDNNHFQAYNFPNPPMYSNLETPLMLGIQPDTISNYYLANHD